MSANNLKDVAASVRRRLFTISKTRGEDFQLTLIYYALERLMYRLSQSKHKDRFILKGAMLFSVWSDTRYRATRDLDLLGRGDNSVAELETVFRDICETLVDEDGLIFDMNTIQGEEIRDGEEYEGVRLSFKAYLGVAKIPIQVDVGFGDAVVPKPEPLDYPTFLNFPAPRLWVYPKETVIAEKMQSMVALGIANSRLKDFFDVWFLSRQFSFDGHPLQQAIRATFDRRRTSLPTEAPLCFTAEFSNDKDKQAQWRAFLKRTGLHIIDLSLSDVIALLRLFLLPPLISVAAFKDMWPPGGPWESPNSER